MWLRERIVEGEISTAFEHCAFPEPDCWGEVVRPEDAGKQRDGVWWIPVRTADGKVGRTREAGSFSMPEGCG